jgi:transcriptional regulator with XRE-family HTH domain
MKTAERALARRLRTEQGLSIKEIARRVGCAQSTASIWVRDIELTPMQKTVLRNLDPAYGGRLLGAARNAEQGRSRRLGYQEEGRTLARRDRAFVSGVILYWAEGSKTTRNSAALSNSDSALLRYYVAWLRTSFDVSDERMRVQCNLFADHLPQQRTIEQFWLDELELPRTCLTKSVVNVYSRASSRKRVGMLPYGTCRVSVHSTRIVQMIFGAIQELGGVERPDLVG